MDDIILWIESHPITIDLFKWSTIILIAQCSGLFRLIRNFTRRPNVTIIQEMSRCFVENIEQLQGKKNVMRAAFLLDVTIRNPTNENVVIESFSLSYKRNNIPFFWSNEFHAISLPDRPRQKTGGSLKYMNVFFSHFPDNLDKQTMSGDLAPKQFQGGYVLFVSQTYDVLNPKIITDHIKVKVSCKLTTGDSITDKAFIKTSTDEKYFENWVPGFLKQIRHQSTWNSMKKKKSIFSHLHL